MKLHIHHARRRDTTTTGRYAYQVCRCGARRTRNPGLVRAYAVRAGWPAPQDRYGRAVKRTGWQPPPFEED